MPDGNGLSKFRIEDHERRLKALEDAKVDVLADRVERLNRDVSNLATAIRSETDEMRRSWKDETTNLRKALITFAGGLLASVILLFLTIMFGTG